MTVISLLLETWIIDTHFCRWFYWVYFVTFNAIITEKRFWHEIATQGHLGNSLQRVSIACYTERCTPSVCPSVCLSNFDTCSTVIAIYKKMG